MLAASGGTSRRLNTRAACWPERLPSAWRRTLTSASVYAARPRPAQSSAAVGSLPSGHLQRATLQNSSHGVSGSAAAVTRTACRASAMPRQPKASTQAEPDCLGQVRWRCTSTKPGSTWQPPRSRIWSTWSAG